MGGSFLWRDVRYSRMDILQSLEVVDGEVLNKRGASKLLLISSRTLDEWMRKKRVPYAKLPGGSVRFRRSQLIDFIANHEVTR